MYSLHILSGCTSTEFLDLQSKCSHHCKAEKYAKMLYFIGAKLNFFTHKHVFVNVTKMNDYLHVVEALHFSFHGVHLVIVHILDLTEG